LGIAAEVADLMLAVFIPKYFRLLEGYTGIAKVAGDSKR
jgi:hypothetical protein